MLCINLDCLMTDLAAQHIAPYNAQQVKHSFTLARGASQSAEFVLALCYAAEMQQGVVGTPLPSCPAQRSMCASCAAQEMRAFKYRKHYSSHIAARRAIGCMDSRPTEPASACTNASVLVDVHVAPCTHTTALAAWGHCSHLT
jgi:hypothetical protein